MKNKNTCKDCKSRYIGCHSECVDYLKYSKERNKLLNLAFKNKLERCEIEDYKIKTYITEGKNKGKYSKRKVGNKQCLEHK